MIALDTNSVIISSSAINAYVGIILLAFIRARDCIQLHWSAVAITYGVAGLLIGFRDFLPPWLANVIANELTGLLLAAVCWYLFRGSLALSSDAWAVQLRTGSMQSINFLVAAPHEPGADRSR